MRKLLRHKKRLGFGKSYDVRKLIKLPTNEHTKGSIGIDSGKLIITLPAKLNFEENYEETTSHLQLLRNAVRNFRPVRLLDFDYIEEISPSAALVLASEVDRWNQKVGGRLKARVEGWNEDIKRLLCQMGYFELLRIPKPDEPWPNGNMTFLEFKRGKVSNLESAVLAKLLRQEIEELVNQKIKKHFLFEGLSEAITNVGQHAYQNANFLTVQQWWVSASFDSKTKTLCVTFYDQGDGIPATIPKSTWFQNVKDVVASWKDFSSWTDSRKIMGAMEIGRTSTGRSERGKGLQNLVEFARAHQGGRLSIYSLCGMYRQTFRLEETTVQVTSDLRDNKNSIGGTLIEWSVKLQ